ncbi:MAG: hypothetical protein WED09_07385 [Homoserinimonas sp.]
MSAIDHKAEAERLLAKGREVVAELREAHSAGRIERADELGKQATGIWAQAQAEATLALVEQQRVGNLLALIEPEDPRSYDCWPDIREGLGLS